jgi:hypothetical protein
MQDSYGNTHTSDTANYQKTLSFYCADNSIDTFPVAFLDSFFDTGGLPHLDLANVSPTHLDARDLESKHHQLNCRIRSAAATRTPSLPAATCQTASSSRRTLRWVAHEWGFGRGLMAVRYVS